MVIYGEDIPRKINERIAKLKSTRKKFLLSIAKRILRGVGDRVLAQDPDWPPLSFKYLERKLIEGYGGLIWVRTGKTVNSFGIFRTESDGFLVAFPGESARIASYMEYGTSRMPPRPLLRPVLQSISPTLKVEFIREFQGSLARVGRYD